MRAEGTLRRRSIAFACVTLLGACTDTSGPDTPKAVLTGLLVSNPVAAGAMATTGNVGVSRSAASPSLNDTIVYVSLTPGTASGGSRATIHRVGSADRLTTAVLEGGFDPVPINANVGGSIVVVVTDQGGAVVGQPLGLRVSARRPPVVVRTEPPPRKRDVPLNTAIVVVFSEPVDPATLSSSTVQLYRGTTAIAGTAALLDGTATAAVFTATAPLEPNADYRLVVGDGVRDLDGDALEKGVITTFTTGTTVLGAVASVSVVPLDSPATIPVGFQLQLLARLTDAQGHELTGIAVVWSSSAPTIASVSAAGLVSAVAPGTATIRATVDSVVGQGDVVVETGLPSVGSVQVFPESTRIAVGTTLGVWAVIRDTAGYDLRLPVTWTSSNEAVATVSPGNGGAGVTGVSNGIVQVVGTVEGKSDTAVVAVGPAGTIVALLLSPPSPTLVLMATVQLQAQARDDQGFLTPIDSTQVVWSSSDASIATISKGLVTGIAGGTTTMTATWNGHEATASISVVSLSFASISTSFQTTCGITLDHAAFCWGYGNDGELGDGQIEFEKLLPVAVVGGHRFATVSVGGGLTCALDDTGAQFCWGGMIPGLDDCINGPCDLSPAAVPGGLKFGTLKVGGTFICALAVDSLAYCWGRTLWGFSGTGDSTSFWIATPHAVVGGRKFAAITVGDTHACALTPAGAAYCWGFNGWGQLGTGDKDDSPQPRAVTGGLTFSSISAGGDNTCALTSAGAAYCWGYKAAEAVTQPLLVASANPFVALDVGDNGQKCGLTSVGTITCWDWGTRQVPDATGNFTTLSVGEETVCGVTAAHVGYCWGNNFNGHLGDGTTTDSNVPVKVLGQP